MKISKHIHSCLLIKDKGKAILLDPGNYSYDEKGLDITSLDQLDFIGITHVHPDHMYPPFIKELLKKFPNAKVIGNKQVLEALKKDDISVTNAGNEMIEFSETDHDKVFDLPQPKNLVFHIFGKLTHPGDTINIDQSNDVLAFPIQGLWTSLTLALDKTVELKPKVVIPIHDWHWKEEVRKNVYERAGKYLSQFNIEFKKLEIGETIEV